MDSVIGVLLLLSFLFCIYFMPSIMACGRRHPNVTAIIVINLFLGWTFLGWVIALAWAATATHQQVVVIHKTEGQK
jgi:prepilin signal peptidase PulO-like enzyme (type II secretory pathway)